MHYLSQGKLREASQPEYESLEKPVNQKESLEKPANQSMNQRMSHVAEEEEEKNGSSLWA